MMNILVYVMLCMSVLDVLINPFIIDKPRKPYTAFNYMGTIFGNAMLIVICGRVLLWW